MPANNIASIRRLRNLSQRRLAEMINIPFSTLCRLESGEIASFEKYRFKLAVALKCKPEDLDADEVEFPTLQVIAVVQWKHFVKELPKAEWETVSRPPSIPPHAKGIRVKGKHLVPTHSSGDILYFDQKPEKNERIFLNRECVVDLDIKRSGERLICWVTPGSEPGKYMLLPPNSPPIVNAKIKAAYPIIDTFKRG